MEIMEGLLDKVLITAVSPLVTALSSWLIAGGLCLSGRRRSAFFIGTAGWLWLLAWSLPPVSFSLRGAIEHQFPFIPVEKLPAAEAIVVLGGTVNAGAPSDEPNLTGAADRLWFAAKLYRAGKAPIVLLSGGSSPPNRPEAEAMRAVMLDLGVPNSALLLEPLSRNTRENASLSAQILHKRNVHHILLVTSALHMPRAVRLFRAENLDAYAAPTDFEASSVSAPYRWLPSADALEGSGRAIKEVLAMNFGR